MVEDSVLGQSSPWSPPAAPDGLALALWARMRRVGPQLLSSLLLVSCAPQRLVLHLSPSTEPSGVDSPLHVLASVDKAADPLPIEGENAVFDYVADTLGESISRASMPWARRHQARRPSGWEMRVEVTDSRARMVDGQLTVELATRVTLTALGGQVYLGQTHGHCQQADGRGKVPEQVVYDCMESMARDLAGWLEGVSP
jgi:hypothetical protein